MRIGIITHYYKSENYGGNLQAYALCRYLNEMGYDAEQISYDIRKEQSFIVRLKLKLRDIWFWHSFDFAKNRSIRRKKIQLFNKSIPHSKRYNKSTVAKCVENYDAFVVGSDQVWHPNAVCDAYLLKFVKSKIKLSYAASFAINELSENQKAGYREALKSFDGISVREEKGVELLKDLTDKRVWWSIDPTLLLSAKQWDEIADRKVEESPYIFCYFLGEDLNYRKLAGEFAEKKQLPIVTLPNLKGKFRDCDSTFGNKQLYDVSPADFVSLIKNATYILTDSFHATAFSVIYEKQFFVFERTGVATMGSRIESLTKLFEATGHFCNTRDKLTLEYLTTIQKINYNKDFPQFKRQKKESIKYLTEILSKKI